MDVPSSHPLDYRLLFEHAPSRLLVVAPDPHRYTILGASDAYLEATITSRDITLRATFDVFPENPRCPNDGVKHLTASFERVLDRRAADAMPIQKYDIRDRSGQFVERHWAPLNKPVISSDGRTLAIIHRVEDVTSFVREGQVLEGEAAHLRHEILVRSQELAEANAALHESAEQRRKIGAIVAHDLRGPLTSIRMGTETLRRRFQDVGAIPPPVVKILQKSSARMEEIINDLDDYTKAQLTGVLPVTREHVNLRAVCEEVVEAAQLAHPDRTIEMAPGEDFTAYVDPKRKRQVLGNLINNALAYGAHDRPVRVAVYRITGFYVLEVSNEGEPIPEEVLPRLFLPFQRGPGSHEQRGHMGLGLYIVHQIAQAHDGGVAVKSDEEGTHFSVFIPAR
jgi:signal transduction histidine kinase